MAKRSDMHNLLFKYLKRFYWTYNRDGKHDEKNYGSFFSRTIKNSPFVFCFMTDVAKINDRQTTFIENYVSNKYYWGYVNK